MYIYIYMCVCVCVCVYMCVCVYIYIYKGIEKERNGKEKKNVQRLMTKDKKGHVC